MTASGPGCERARRAVAAATAALLLVVPAAPPRASTLTWMGRGTVAAGAIGIGVLARRAAVLVAAAVAARCIQVSCLDGIGTFLSDHPHIGWGILNHEFNAYSRKHPDEADIVAQAQAAAGNLRADRTGPDNRTMSRVEVSPPGDCRPKDHGSLQARVDAACDGPQRACRFSDPTAVLQEKLGRNRECMNARNRINETCFKGGDFNHRLALKEATAAVKSCETLLGSAP